MTQQVNNTVIQKKNENNAQVSDCNRFLACEEIVEELVERGLPTSYVPANFISKIATNYGISFQEAKTCLRMAVKQLEANQAQNNQQTQKPQEQLYAQCGYYYPQGYTKSENATRPDDGMGSLSSLGSYNRLMFGIKS